MGKMYNLDVDSMVDEINRREILRLRKLAYRLCREAASEKDVQEALSYTYPLSEKEVEAAYQWARKVQDA